MADTDHYSSDQVHGLPMLEPVDLLILVPTRSEFLPVKHYFYKPDVKYRLFQPNLLKKNGVIQVDVPPTNLDQDYVLIAQLGVGQQQARNRLNELLHAIEPREILLLGTAGGLNLELKSGELVFASKVIKPDGTATELKCKNNSGCPPWVTGTIFSSNDLIATTAEKASIFKLFHADCVEMEAFGCLECLQEMKKDIPFNVLRVVLDDAQNSLPHEITKLLNTQGNIAWVNLLRLCCSKPWMIQKLFKLQLDSRACYQQMIMGLDYYLKNKSELEQ